MKSIIYTGAFRFPNKDAASQRVLGIAKALKAKNINTIFGGWESSSREEDLNKDGKFRFANFEYYSQSELDLNSKNILQKFYRFLFLGGKTIHWIKYYLARNKVSAIVVYNSNSLFILRVFHLSKRFNFKVVCDCTEWSEGRQLPGGRYGVVNLDNNIRLNIVYPLIKNVIVISSFLQRYLDRKGCNTLLVPPLIDIEEKKWLNQTAFPNPSSSNTKKIIYAGDPGKKDLLESIFIALDKINTDKIQVEFIILGIEKTLLKTTFFSGGEIHSYINCIGRVPHEEVPEYYQQCHFSILLREDKKYANAGFPTKLVESLTSGVPIITNTTSDIPRYIINGENGFLLEDTSGQALFECFKQIISLTEVEVKTMQEKAINTSKNSFDFKLYSTLLENYMLNLNTRL